MAEHIPDDKTVEGRVVRGLFQTAGGQELAGSYRGISVLVDRAWALAAQIAPYFSDESYTQGGRVLRQATSPSYEFDGMFSSGRLASVQILSSSPFEGEHSGPTRSQFYFEAHMVLSTTSEPVCYRYIPAKIRSVYLVDSEIGQQLGELTPDKTPREFSQAQTAITELEHRALAP